MSKAEIATESNAGRTPRYRTQCSASASQNCVFVGSLDVLIIVLQTKKQKIVQHCTKCTMMKGDKSSTEIIGMAQLLVGCALIFYPPNDSKDCTHF